MNREQFRQKLKSDIEKDSRSITASIKPDEKSRREQQNLELEELKNKLEKQKLENKNLRQIIGLRKKLSWTVFGFLLAWSITIFILIFMKGYFIIRISDNIIITLLSTTTINIIGLFVIIVRYIFPSNR